MSVSIFIIGAWESTECTVPINLHWEGQEIYLNSLKLLLSLTHARHITYNDENNNVVLYSATCSVHP